MVCTGLDNILRNHIFLELDKSAWKVPWSPKTAFIENNLQKHLTSDECIEHMQRIHLCEFIDDNETF